MAERSPTLRRRELASRLRELRKQAGLTVDDVAHELLCSPPKISRIETGTRGASLRDVRDLCRLYRVSDAEQARLMTIAREAKQQGWWNKFDDLGIESLIGLETEAMRISGHDASVVPWAFQTEQYARAVIKGVLPRMDDRILDERVTARMTRQEILRSPEPPYLWSLIDESALHRAVGGNGMMREQFDKILEVAAASNVTVQVVPFDAGAQPAGNLYLERDAEIQRYREVLEHMRACALSPTNSVKYIEKIRKALEELLSMLRSIIGHSSERKFAVSNFEPSLPDIPWRTAVKSSGGSCVKVARRDGVIMVADSKHLGGPVLSYTPQEFDAFLDGAKNGEFDDLLVEESC